MQSRVNLTILSQKLCRLIWLWKINYWRILGHIFNLKIPCNGHIGHERTSRNETKMLLPPWTNFSVVTNFIRHFRSNTFSFNIFFIQPASTSCHSSLEIKNWPVSVVPAYVCTYGSTHICIYRAFLFRLRYSPTHYSLLLWDYYMLKLVYKSLLLFPSFVIPRSSVRATMKGWYQTLINKQ